MKTIENSPQINSNVEKEFQELQNKYALLEQEFEQTAAKLNWYKEQFRLSKEKQFGSSSEKSNSDQLSIFNEAEKEFRPKKQEASIEEITYKRKKSKGLNKKSFDDLPVEIIEYKLEEEDKICPSCDSPLHEMSKEIRKELKIIPAQVKIVEHVRYVYACRQCEKENISTPIITAKMPNPVLNGSFVSPSLLAYIMDQKYSQAVPLYRQEKQFNNFGIDLSRQNFANWIIHGANSWLVHIYDRMHYHLLDKGVIFADETTRSSKHPKKFLKGFSGYLQTDGYPGYNDVEDVIQVGCFAHARRNFTDALKALPEDALKSKTTAQEGVYFCNELFRIERNLKDLPPKNRYEKRLEQSKPVLEDFLSWLKIKKKQVLPKSSLGKAVKYCLNQWPKLEAFLLDGRLEISNNTAERAIKPFVIGRKNFLFSKSPKGATSSAVTYSIIETAKANSLNPFYYLNYLFEKLPNIDLENMNELDKLLPWSGSIPEDCKIPNKD